MKIRQPSVGQRPVDRPDFGGGQVAPQANPFAEVAQKVGAAGEQTGSVLIRIEQQKQERRARIEQEQQEQRARIEQEQQERLARTRAKEADSKLADGYQRILSQADGFRSKTGRDALDARDGVVKELDAHQERILAALSPVERDLVSGSASELRRQAAGVVDGHYARQLEAYEIGESEARADMAMRGAVEGFFAPAAPGSVISDKHGEEHVVGAPSPFESNRAAARGELVDLAQRRGLGPEQTKALLQKADDSLHGVIVGRLSDEGRSREALAFVQKFGDRMSDEVRTKAMGRVREANDAEHAESVAVEMLGASGTLVEKLDQLESFRKDGLVPVKVKLEAERRLLQMTAARRAETDRAEAVALDEAQAWSTANRAPLPDSKRAALGSRAAAYDLWFMNGNAFVTTNDGALRMASTSDDDLRRYESEAALVKDWQTSLSPQHLQQLVTRWKSVTGAKLNQSEEFRLGMDTAIRDYMNQRRWFEDFPAVAGNSQDLGRRMSSFEAAVVKAANGFAKTKTRDEALQLAVAKVYSDGVVLDGKWMPTVMLTDAESKRAKRTTLPYDIPNSEEDVVGYLRRGKELPFVANELLAGMPDTGEGQFRKVNQRTSDGREVRVTNNERVTTAAQAQQILGPDATQSQIAAYVEDSKKLLDEQAAKAQEIVSLENQIRADELMSRWPALVEEEFTKVYGEMLSGFILYQDQERYAFTKDHGMIGRGIRDIDTAIREATRLRNSFRGQMAMQIFEPTPEEARIRAEANLAERYGPQLSAVGVDPNQFYIHRIGRNTSSPLGFSASDLYAGADKLPDLIVSEEGVNEPAIVPDSIASPPLPTVEEQRTMRKERLKMLRAMHEIPPEPRK